MHAVPLKARKGYPLELKVTEGCKPPICHLEKQPMLLTTELSFQSFLYILYPERPVVTVVLKIEPKMATPLSIL